MASSPTTDPVHTAAADLLDLAATLIKIAENMASDPMAAEFVGPTEVMVLSGFKSDYLDNIFQIVPEGV